MQVIFRERATNYRALLREKTYKDKTSYGSLPPCSSGVARIETLELLLRQTIYTIDNVTAAAWLASSVLVPQHVAHVTQP